MEYLKTVETPELYQFVSVTEKILLINCFKTVKTPELYQFVSVTENFKFEIRI